MSSCTAAMHGTGHAAQRHGCTCPDAVAARRAQRGPRVQSRSRRGRHEPEVVQQRIQTTAALTRAGLSANEIALRLGVSYRSAQRYRARLKQTA